MTRLAVIYMLALSVLVSGVAQSQARVFKFTPAVEAVKRGFVGLADNVAVSSLKKGLLYVGLPLMVCFGLSCDGEKDLPQKNSESVQQVEENVQQIEAVADDGFWFVSEESDYQNGVYYPRPVWSSFGYHLVKIHDETGKLLPETLRSGWYILYKDKDVSWGGSGRYWHGKIDSISEEGVVLDISYVAIDVSQVVGVSVKSDPYDNKEAMFSVMHILPYLYGAMSDLRIEINTTDDIHYSGYPVSSYTSGHVMLSMREDLYYIRQDHGEHVFTQHLSGQDAIFNLILLERDNLIMMEDLTIIDE